MKAMNALRQAAMETLEGRRLFAAHYDITDLTPGVHDSTAHGVSTNGHVALQYDGHAAMWYNGVLTDLGFNGTAYDVSNNGTVVGVDTSNGTSRPFVWKDGVKKNPLIDGVVATGQINAINAGGTFVGTAFNGNDRYAFVGTFSGLSISRYIPDGYVAATGTGINDNGQIIGNLAVQSGQFTIYNRSYRFTEGNYVILGTLPTTGTAYSEADKGITSAGNVAMVGKSNVMYDPSTYADHIYTVNNGGMGTPADKGILGNNYDIVSTDMNDSGVVAYTIFGGATPQEAVVYDGTHRSLTSTVDNSDAWTLFNANGINNEGWIVGRGFDEQDGGFHAYLLKPAVERFYFTGRVWNDTDKDGVFDAGESASGVRTVYLDANKNGVLDSGEYSEQSNPGGYFGFTNVPAGTYQVRRVLPSGYYLSNGDDNGAKDYRTITLNENKTNFNLGSAKLPRPGVGYSLTGRLWNDTDKDGVFDANESPSGTRTVYLDQNRNGSLDWGEKSTTSNANGEYTFSGLAAGSYFVSRVFPSNYYLSNPTFTNGTYRSVTIGSSNVIGQHLGSAKLPRPAPKATLSGVLFNDTDADGIWDGNETRSGSRQVFIDTDGDGKLDAGERSVFSDALGAYTFDDLDAGTYKISRVFPSGYGLSNGNGKYVTAAVAAGEQKIGVHLGSKKL